MKARFDKRQNKVTVKQLNGKDYIFLCLNGKTVKETPEGQTSHRHSTNTTIRRSQQKQARWTWTT